MIKSNNCKSLIKLSPRGFCNGVVKAWDTVIKTVKQYPDRNVYMLGMFVHNHIFLNSLLSQYPNLYLLDDTYVSRYELVKQKKKDFKEAILILSAHGTDYKTIKLAKKKFFQVINTTCSYVYKTHNKILEYLKTKRSIVFIGTINHPETNACISLNKKIILITQVSDLKKLDINKPYVFLNQTTLSIYDLNNYYVYIKNHFKDYLIENDICNATKLRQEAIINNLDKFDYLIVVGDKKSNNSNALLKIANSYQKDGILVSNLDDIDAIDFIQYNRYAITSGASTPSWITNEIISYLINNKNLKELND